MSQQSELPSSVTETTVGQTTEKKQLSREELKEAISKQVEYYFSRQNLSTDHFLVSQMNHDLFVPVSVIANFKMIKTLTDDYDLICESVKNSSQVVVDELNKKLKPNIVLKRNTVIIRDIPQTVPQEQILKLFSSDNQPLTIHSDIGNTWFTSFETEEKTLEAIEHLKTQNWEGKPIQARIKTESLLKTVGTAPVQQGASSHQAQNQQNNYNRGGNRKFNNRPNQQNSTGPNVPQTKPGTQGNTRPQTNNSPPQQQNNQTSNNRNSSRGGNQPNRGRSNSGSNRPPLNGNTKQPRGPRKDALNLNSVKNFPPLPKLNESTEQVGYGSQKFLRYSKQTVLRVFMEQQEKGEHGTKPEILIGNECIAILNEPKKDLELHKPQMDKSQLANEIIPPESESKDSTTSTTSSLKPTNLMIPRSSFAEAAITAKDIKTPDTPSTSHFFAKTRKRRGSNATGHNHNNVTSKPHHTKPTQKPSESNKQAPTKTQESTTAPTTTTSAAATTSEQPSWVSVVSSTKK
ncbi:hypothetical protein C9374_010699 [Naegleria lovaniensis]|uniref:HTH La-type RNA-binding domain-containing protein n=1 Tax=Naegleria lovaniensis TaxID=51637 RepID=A0AA88GAW6_NAELO|nr:uncharacterized protein C9374_010699 [Naegleria lovaniensis]KAG2374415.1 hypothetical protein C9374_010699 [Naegleria lovaniensis]